MQLTIHRGTHEVGGTCIEVSSQGFRLILDVGLPLFGLDREPLDSAQLRRKTTEQLHAERILPAVPGLFDDQNPPTAILLSHAHLDHTGLLAHSRPEIPIYASRGTSKMMLAGSLFANQPALPRDRFRELNPGTSTQIGEFTITPFAVDHSIFGCLAFLIEAEGKTVLYTGDLRLHGRKPGMQRTLIDSVRNRNIDVLLMEGTHFGFPDGNPLNEYELEDQIVKAVREAPSLVLASFSPQHVDRLVAFIRAAIKTGRTFVADEYTAFLLHLIGTEIPVPVPGKDNSMRVFIPRQVEDAAQRRGRTSILEKFESSRITIEEIRQTPEKFLMVYRGLMLETDFENRFPNNTRCLYSRWEGYLDRPEWEPTKAALTNAGGMIIPLHTSGHMFATDIISFIHAVNPKTIIPVHTFEPERFREHFQNVRVLTDGEQSEI